MVSAIRESKNLDRRQITALPIILKPLGFVPSEITKPAGDFFSPLAIRAAF